MNARGYLLSYLVAGLCSSLWATGSNAQAASPSPISNQMKTAIFAGGCFWSMESAFEKVDGVKSAVSGFTGGSKANPTYEDVSAGNTGHAEAVEVIYDPKKVSYEKLLDVYWHSIDPTTKDRQFYDVGSQYRTDIFYQNEAERLAAEASKQKLEKSGRFKDPIVTEILPATKFYPAEEYHQDYYKKNAAKYKAYRLQSGRDQYFANVWGT